MDALSVMQSLYLKIHRQTKQQCLVACLSMTVTSLTHTAVWLSVINETVGTFAAVRAGCVPAAVLAHQLVGALVDVLTVLTRRVQTIAATA